MRNVLRSLHLTESRLLVGVSGGADSTCLLEILAELRREFPLEVRAAHLNHQLRGTDSEADARWLEARCRQLDLPLVLERADVRHTAKETGRGIEETARDLRYRFLQRVAVAADCAAVAVAHTANDQAETILHHILRGTGLGGLRGMPVSRRLCDNVVLIRPLLDVGRTSLEAWLAARDLKFRTDATNADSAYTRNRIRHELLPLLREQFNPEVNTALVRLGRQAADVEQAVEFAATRLLQQSLLQASEIQAELDCDQLANVPRHLLRSCFVQLWLQQDWPRAAYGFREWDRLAALVLEGSRNSISLPARVQATWRKRRLRLERGTANG